MKCSGIIRGIIPYLFAVIWLLLVEGEPQFDKKTVNVTAIQGQDAVLPCTVLYKENYQVSENQSKNYSKTCLKQPLKKDKTKVLKTTGSLMKVQSIAECSWSILQYF